MARLSYRFENVQGDVRIILHGEAGWEARLHLDENDVAAGPLFLNGPGLAVDKGAMGVHQLLETLDLTLRTERIGIAHQILLELESRTSGITLGMGDTWRAPVANAFQGSKLVGGECPGYPWSIYVTSGQQDGLDYGAPLWYGYLTFSPKASETLSVLKPVFREALGQAFARNGAYYLACLHTLLFTDNLTRLPPLFESIKKAQASVRWGDQV